MGPLGKSSHLSNSTQFSVFHCSVVNYLFLPVSVLCKVHTHSAGTSGKLTCDHRSDGGLARQTLAVQGFRDDQLRDHRPCCGHRGLLGNLSNAGGNGT